MPDDRLLRGVQRFLDANYPCRCGDDGCPGNLYEAMELVELVRSFLMANVPAYGGAEGDRSR